MKRLIIPAILLASCNPKARIIDQMKLAKDSTMKYKFIIQIEEGEIERKQFDTLAQKNFDINFCRKIAKDYAAMYSMSNEGEIYYHKMWKFQQQYDSLEMELKKY